MSILPLVDGSGEPDDSLLLHAVASTIRLDDSSSAKLRFQIADISSPLRRPDDQCGIAAANIRWPPVNYLAARSFHIEKPQCHTRGDSGEAAYGRPSPNAPSAK